MKNLLFISITFLVLSCSTGNKTENIKSQFIKTSYVSPISNKEVRIRIETLNGYNLVNDNEINIINSGIVTMQRTGDYKVSIRDMGSDLIEVTIKLDAINITKLLECSNTQ